MKNKMNVAECKKMLNAIDAENDQIFDQFQGIQSAKPRTAKPPKGVRRTFAGSILYRKGELTETARLDTMIAMYAVLSDKVTLEDIALTSAELFQADLTAERIKGHVIAYQAKEKHFYRDKISFADEGTVRYSQDFIDLTVHVNQKTLKSQIKEMKELIPKPPQS